MNLISHLKHNRKNKRNQGKSHSQDDTHRQRFVSLKYFHFLHQSIIKH